MKKKVYGLGVSDQELLVLDSNEDSGNFELHSIESKPGEVVGSKKGARKIKQFNNRRISVPPHDVDSEQTLLAVVGQQTIDGKSGLEGDSSHPNPWKSSLLILLALSMSFLQTRARKLSENTYQLSPVFNHRKLLIRA